jgi:DNA-binding NtrC family response regulator
MKDTLYPSFGVLVADDETAWLRSMAISLERSGGITNIVQCPDSRKVMELLQQQDIGLILLDLTMPHISGEKLLQMVNEQHPEIIVIIISGMNQVETAVKCMQMGAFDYFVKTTEEDRLVAGVLRAIRMLELHRVNQSMSRRLLSDTLENPEAFSEIITCDKAMRSIFQYIEAVAKSSQPVLITGESGVGKELIARALHQLSRCSGPLVAVNVAGLDETIFADALFGHVRGAFTGAEAARSGMVEQAADGTLFLDEIGDLSTMTQVKLLRLLQEGEYFPLGSDRPRRMRARVVVATNQDLAARQASGQFRKDLYYRLCTHRVHLPPLRQRMYDLPLLLDHFLDEAARSMAKKKPTYPKELPILLSTCHFPGNIRELKSMVYDAMSRHTSGILSMDVFRRGVGSPEAAATRKDEASVCAAKVFATATHLPTLEEAADLLVAEAMRRAKGNQTIASRMLGISQPALSKRLKHSRKCT